MDVFQLPALSDNYIYLLHHLGSDTRICVDPSEAGPVKAAMDQLEWPHLDIILNTHWHPDHTDGNVELKAIGGARTVVIGPKSSGPKGAIPGIDKEVSGADAELELTDGTRIQILDVPGHTLDHIAFWLPTSGALFSGDTVLPMGCGRLFEGAPEQMHESLGAIKRLPAQTQIFCAHEYTLANAKFALTVDPDNEALKARAAAAEEERAAGRPTVPSTVADELETNPFLRADSADMRTTIGMTDPHFSDIDVFAEVRKRKDDF